jgi:hypothetical protein
VPFHPLHPGSGVPKHLPVGFAWLWIFDLADKIPDDMYIEEVLDIYPHPKHRLRCDVDNEDAAPSAPRRRPVLKQPIEIDELQPELEVGQQDGKKRRRDEEDEVHILPEVKRLREELSSHPLYEENAAKVILISSDGQRFSVDTHTLSTFR